MDKRKYLHRLTSATNLPAESFPGRPVVEIFGDCRVLIERHRGVMAYDCNMIRVKVHGGQICISGCNLVIAQMTKFQLVIFGEIQSVSLMKGRECCK